MSDLSTCLVYGAYGYTGVLIAERAVALGLRPVLAGRDDARLAPLAERLGLERRVFGLDDPAALDAGLAGIDVALHCAGPFAVTSRPMVDACLRTRTHYVDITGEVTVFEACAARHDEAREAGVVVLPGGGLDIVPTDCLAAHLASRLPTATHLTLAFHSRGTRLSHGTATTTVSNLGLPSLVRRDGRLEPVRMGSRTRTVDFGRGPRSCLGIPWGDVSTGFRSTGIPNIEVYLAMRPGLIRGAKLLGFLGPLARSRFVRAVAQRRVDAGPAGPDEGTRRDAETLFYGEVSDGTSTLAARLRTPEGYDLTAMTSLEIARRLAEEPSEGGFYTPSMRFGADFVLGFDGVSRTDLD